MPARDRYHQVVVEALEAEGWRITHDPFSIPVGRRSLLVDLGAECLLAAENEERQIAVEVKTFGGPSDVRDLSEALGQYLLYETFLQDYQPPRPLYLALTDDAYRRIFKDPLGQGVMDRFPLKLLVFNPNEKAITQWIPKL